MSHQLKIININAITVEDFIVKRAILQYLLNIVLQIFTVEETKRRNNFTRSSFMEINVRLSEDKVENLNNNAKIVINEVLLKVELNSFSLIFFNI